MSIIKYFNDFNDIPMKDSNSLNKYDHYDKSLFINEIQDYIIPLHDDMENKEKTMELLNETLNMNENTFGNTFLLYNQIEMCYNQFIDETKINKLASRLCYNDKGICDNVVLFKKGNNDILEELFISYVDKHLHYGYNVIDNKISKFIYNNKIKINKCLRKDNLVINILEENNTINKLGSYLMKEKYMVIFKYLHYFMKMLKYIIKIL